MNKYYKCAVLIIFFQSMLLPFVNSQSIDSLFINMPARINPLLNRETKLKMLNNFKKNIPDSLQNTLGGKAIVLKYDSANNFVKFQNAPNSKMEIFSFKTVQGISAIGVISTVGDTLLNSEIQFFNPDWSVAQIIFKKPEIKDWIVNQNINENGTSPAWATEQTAVGFIRLEYDVEKAQLKAQQNFLKYISDDVRELVEPHFTNAQVSFSLKGNEWVKQ